MKAENERFMEKIDESITQMEDKIFNIITKEVAAHQMREVQLEAKVD